jgi:hypothetical protein
MTEHATRRLPRVVVVCVLHAHCPVTVVRPEPRAEEAAAARMARHTLEDSRRQTTPTFL